jgi:hypothetical protein
MVRTAIYSRILLSREDTLFTGSTHTMYDICLDVSCSICRIGR